MKFTESLIGEYAKKIYGFAYSKTQNPYDADDLSQEIVFALCGIAFPEKQIKNMDAYVYKICRYTWSKYLRKNKPARDSLCGNDCIVFMDDGSNIENDFITAEICSKLRQEIMYLNKIRREAIILFYYENKSGKEISTLLGIPAATVRWHLHTAKNILKERMEMMEQNTIYRPMKFSVGHYGWCESDVLQMLETDVLMQNICFVCFDNLMSVEEISRKLSVASVYLEDKLDKLCSMEYMTKSAKGKYQTNFFVRSLAYQLEHNRYQYENTEPIAIAFYNVIHAALPEIKEIGPVRTLSDDILQWDMLLYFMMQEIEAANSRMIKALHIEHSSPIRPDGTRHWLRMAVSTKEELLPDTAFADDNFRDFFLTANGFGKKKSTITPENINSLQLDSPFFCGWRTLSASELQTIKRMHDLLQNLEEPNEFDKSAISSLIKKGYALRDDEGLKLMIPYFNKEQVSKLDAILKKYADLLLDRNEIDRIFCGYAEHMRGFIPACVCENERNHYLTSYDPYNAIPYLLMKNGYLKTPSEQEQNYICTVVWET